MNKNIIKRIKNLAQKHIIKPKSDGDYHDYWNHIIFNNEVYTYNVLFNSYDNTWDVNAYPNRNNEIISDEEVYISLTD